MDKYLITFTSSNRITGEMMVTTSPRSTCPTSCPLIGADCYAEHGHLGHWLWHHLDKNDPNKQHRIPIYNFAQLLVVIRCLAPGSIWRHNQAGDLPTVDGVTIDRAKLRQLTHANHGRHCFTFTHHKILDHYENQQTIKEANSTGFMINLSADDLHEADQLADLDIAPVSVVVPRGQKDNLSTPKGRKVTICPARRKKGVTCSTCQICTKPHKAIIAFPKL